MRPFQTICDLPQMYILCFPLPSTLDLLLYQTAFPGGRLLCWDREEESLRNFDKRSSFQCPVSQSTWLSLLKQVSLAELLSRSSQTVVCLCNKRRFLWLAENEWEEGERREKILVFKNEESSWLSIIFKGCIRLYYVSLQLITHIYASWTIGSVKKKSQGLMLC